MKFDTKLLKTKLKAEVTSKRYDHSLEVAKVAKRLAEKYGEDINKAEIAGLLHDCAKYWPKEKLVTYIENNNELSDALLQYNEELWHGPVASIAVQEMFNISDTGIIHAIRYHTSGRVGMSLLEKIVCLADYIEPTRDFPEVNEIRMIAEYDLNKALLASFDNTINFLIHKKSKIYPLTIDARNDLIDEITVLAEGGK